MRRRASSASRKGSVCCASGTGLARTRQVYLSVSAAAAKSGEAFGCSAFARARMRSRSAARADSRSSLDGADLFGLLHRAEQADVALHQELGLARAGGRLDDERAARVEGATTLRVVS